jgi:hypothetical protein
MVFREIIRLLSEPEAKKSTLCEKIQTYIHINCHCVLKSILRFDPTPSKILNKLRTNFGS